MSGTKNPALESSLAFLGYSPPVSAGFSVLGTRWDTAVEEGVNRLCARPKENWSDVPGEHNFPFNAVLRQVQNRRLELFGRHVYIVLGSNTRPGDRKNSKDGDSGNTTFDGHSELSSLASQGRVA